MLSLAVHVHLAVLATAHRLAHGIARRRSEAGQTSAEYALVLLGAAMSLLAVAYLAVQYMLALREMRFLIALGVAAAAEIAVLAGTGLSSIVGFATVVTVMCDTGMKYLSRLMPG